MKNTHAIRIIRHQTNVTRAQGWLRHQLVFSTKPEPDRWLVESLAKEFDEADAEMLRIFEVEVAS
jgi:hypothetical protein